MKKRTKFFPVTIIKKPNIFLTEQNEKENGISSIPEMLVDYTEYSTIQGLIYIFFPYQTIFGKVFWTITILLMLALGFYWCYNL